MKIAVSKIGVYTADENSMYNLMNVLKKENKEEREWLAEVIYNTLYAKGYFDRETYGFDV